jgi:predicted TIM-barrel fold metal-dependent hydrolase
VLVVDTHTHVVSDDEDAYPLHPRDLTGAWYREDPCSVERLLSLMDASGVDRVVLVQGMSAYGTDNSYTHDSARRHPDRCTSVAFIDLRAPDPEVELRRLVEVEGMRGLRWVSLFDGQSLEEPAAVWDAIAELGIPVVVTILADALPGLADAIPRLPAVPLALDHCGFADFAAGVPDELAELARFPNLHLKVSSNVLESAEPHGDVRDLVGDLAARFGAGRLMWGSDYSQTHDRPYPELVARQRHAASRLPDADRESYLGGTALRLWPELAG